MIVAMKCRCDTGLCEVKIEESPTLLANDRGGQSLSHGVLIMEVKTVNTKKADGTETYQQDRIYDSSGIAPALARGKSDLNVMQIGNIVDDSEIGFKNPQRGRIYDTDGIAPTLNTCSGGGLEPKVLVKNATKQGFAEVKDGGVMNIAFPDSDTRRGRVIDEGDTSPTLDTGCEIGMIDGARIRKLTPRECFRLQGFPDEYFDRAAEVNSDSQLYKQAGNSVTVPVIYEIAKRL